MAVADFMVIVRSIYDDAVVVAIVATAVDDCSDAVAVSSFEDFHALTSGITSGWSRTAARARRLFRVSFHSYLSGYSRAAVAQMENQSLMQTARFPVLQSVLEMR